MAQESQKADPAPAQKPVTDNLVEINNPPRDKQVLEINNQMSALETSISKLSKQLTATNKQIKTEVERLTASDAEITDKVADTYKQLGVIETTFKDLNNQSSKINKELKTVNGSIKSLEKESRASLDAAMHKQEGVNDELRAVNDDFRSVHESLIEKSESLSKKATALTRKLNKSIKDNSQALTELEARIVAELEKIAKNSAVRDDQLDEKIASQKAKMLLMQSVDEALDKRASALEQTSQKLLDDSAELQDATKVLDVLTSKLSSDVEALELFTRQLAEQNAAQQGEIDGLQDRTDSLSRTLLALANLEKKHFRALAAGSLLLLLAILGAFFYGEYQRGTENDVEAQRNEVVNEQLSDLTNRVSDEQMASQVFYDEITSLGKTIEQLKGDLQSANNALQAQVQDVNANLETRLQEMTDQVESIDGRVQYLAPLYNFGSSNTIHGSQWVSKLKPELLSIKIATVSDKQDLYEIAQRYNNHFTQELGYFMTDAGQYTLIYGGQFEDEAELAELMRRMPAYMNGQRIEPISNEAVLAQVIQ
jgi:chromosome segregation ATPase